MYNFLNNLVSEEWFQIVFKILLAGVLASIIGLERSARAKPAGWGTHAILGISACMITITSAYMSSMYDMDAARIPSQLLPGIGFIGAGTVIQNGINVRGVTTAAALFFVTCIGIVVGQGFYFAAIFSTLIVFLLLVFSHNLSDKIEHIEVLEINLKIKKEFRNTLNAIESFLEKQNVEIVSISRPDKALLNSKIESINIIINYDTNNITKSEILSELMSNENIDEVNMYND